MQVLTGNGSLSIQQCVEEISLELLWSHLISGHYVPQLSQLIYRRNKGIQNPFINLKGFMVLFKIFMKCIILFIHIYILI